MALQVGCVHAERHRYGADERDRGVCGEPQAARLPDRPVLVYRHQHAASYRVFVLVHDNHAMLLINYKDWADDTHTKFKITQTFVSSWVSFDNLYLQIDGQSLSRIYDNFVAQVSGIGEHKAGCMADIVALKQQIASAEMELKSLEKRMRKEPQLDRQMQMNKQVKAKHKELDSLKMKLDNLK